MTERLTGAALDRLVAARLGWQGETLSFSTYIGHAWKLTEHFGEQWSLWADGGKFGLECILDGRGYLTYADSAPLAICYTYLKVTE